MEPVPGYLLDSIVAPWYESLKDPARAQRETLASLVKGYSKTDYGARFGVDEGTSPSDFANRVPVASYASLSPYFARVRSGDTSSLLPEPVVRWVMTRGTTGSPKIIPVTDSHLALILSAGARAIVSWGTKRDPTILQRRVLNLNFPSEVGRFESQGASGNYGYSSGTYAKLNPSLGLAELVPKQEEIDELGPGIRRGDWEKRFELVYSRAKGEDVGCTMGVVPVITSFAKYVKKHHGLAPKDAWKMGALFCTSVPKIHTRYGPILERLFGDVPIVEMYTATEGVFGQQLDELPYFSPNYDAYYFEVKVGNVFRPLYELRRGEWGRVIVSTPLFPRYDMCDLIESEGKGYFRVFGRAKPSVVAEHVLFNLLTARFA